MTGDERKEVCFLLLDGRGDVPESYRFVQIDVLENDAPPISLLALPAGSTMRVMVSLPPKK